MTMPLRLKWQRAVSNYWFAETGEAGPWTLTLSDTTLVLTDTGGDVIATRHRTARNLEDAKQEAEQFVHHQLMLRYGHILRDRTLS